VAPGWDSSEAWLQRYAREGEAWIPVGHPFPARLGARGLAWGRGLHPSPDGAPAKREGDLRSPAGVFALGDAFVTESPRWSEAWPVRQVTEGHLWVEDPAHPWYNQHHVVPLPLDAWQQTQQMKLTDPAHALKVVVEHNTAPVQAAAGSAIFLHFWRDGGGRPTAGCTSLAPDDLEALVAWLDPRRAPTYALMPTEAWATWGPRWGLPTPPLPRPTQDDARLLR
jgi:L,D-peptidoglycan transpeptidase YkuD (ErfK/YbiS/YcfS/YnhG family)